MNESHNDNLYYNIHTTKYLTKYANPHMYINENISCCNMVKSYSVEHIQLVQ